jgi:hypothetical protein
MFLAVVLSACFAARMLARIVPERKQARASPRLI